MKGNYIMRKQFNIKSISQDVIKFFNALLKLTNVYEMVDPLN